MERDLPRCATFTRLGALSTIVIMNLVDRCLWIQVLTVLGMVSIGAVPVLREFDIWGDGAGNFLNGSEKIGLEGGRSGKGKKDVGTVTKDQ